MNFYYDQIFIVVVALLIVSGICLGLLIALVIFISGNRTKQGNLQNLSNPVGANTQKGDLAEVIKKIDDYQAENAKRANRDRYERIGYISWGFALASTGLSIASMHLSGFATIVSIYTAIGFAILGIGLLLYSRKYK
jgi:hypothetical protein